MKPDKRKKLLALVLLLAAAALIALFFILKAKGYLEIFTSVEALQEYVSSFGIWAPIVFMLLQIVQVIISPIPGNVTTLAGGALFGFLPALIYSIIAVFIGSMLCFGLARACGKPLVYKLVSPEVVDKYLVVLAKKQRLTLALLFLFPFFPDDALCLLAGLTGYSARWFAGMILLTRPWGLIFSALVGSGSIVMPVWGWVLIALLAVCAMYISMRYGSRMEDFLLSKVQNLRSEHKK